MDWKRTYTKVDEFTFKVEQDRHIEETLDIAKQFNAVAQLLNWMRECVKNANDMQDKFVRLSESYNVFIDILTEAKKECWFDYKIPEKITIPDCFDIIEVEPKNIPTVDFKLNEKAS